MNEPIERVRSSVEYAWTVSWTALPQVGSGLNYRELGLFRQRDSFPEPAPLTLAQLLGRGSQQVIHEGSREIGDGGVIWYTDETAFAAFAENQRVIFVLNGAGAVRRYTSWHPDTATFEYSRYGDLEISCNAQIHYIDSR